MRAKLTSLASSKSCHCNLPSLLTSVPNVKGNKNIIGSDKKTPYAVLSVSVCHLLSPAKTAEAIAMPFASRTRVGTGKHVLYIADRFEANIVLCLCSFNTIQPYGLNY